MILNNDAMYRLANSTPAIIASFGQFNPSMWFYHVSNEYLRVCLNLDQKHSQGG